MINILPYGFKALPFVSIVENDYFVLPKDFNKDQIEWYANKNLNEGGESNRETWKNFFEPLSSGEFAITNDKKFQFTGGEKNYNFISGWFEDTLKINLIPAIRMRDKVLGFFNVLDVLHQNNFYPLMMASGKCKKLTSTDTYNNNAGIDNIFENIFDANNNFQEIEHFATRNNTIIWNSTDDSRTISNRYAILDLAINKWDTNVDLQIKRQTFNIESTFPKGEEDLFTAKRIKIQLQIPLSRKIQILSTKNGLEIIDPTDQTNQTGQTNQIDPIRVIETWEGTDINQVKVKSSSTLASNCITPALFKNVELLQWNKLDGRLEILNSECDVVDYSAYGWTFNKKQFFSLNEKINYLPLNQTLWCQERAIVRKTIQMIKKLDGKNFDLEPGEHLKFRKQGKITSDGVITRKTELLLSLNPNGIYKVKDDKIFFFNNGIAQDTYIEPNIPSDYLDPISTFSAYRTQYSKNEVTLSNGSTGLIKDLGDIIKLEIAPTTLEIRFNFPKEVYDYYRFELWHRSKEESQKSKVAEWDSQGSDISIKAIFGFSYFNYDETDNTFKIADWDKKNFYELKIIKKYSQENKGIFYFVDIYNSLISYTGGSFLFRNLTDWPCTVTKKLELNLQGIFLDCSKTITVANNTPTPSIIYCPKNSVVTVSKNILKVKYQKITIASYEHITSSNKKYFSHFDKLLTNNQLTIQEDISIIPVEYPYLIFNLPQSNDNFLYSIRLRATDVKFFLEQEQNIVLNNPTENDNKINICLSVPKQGSFPNYYDLFKGDTQIDQIPGWNIKRETEYWRNREKIIFSYDLFSGDNITVCSYALTKTVDEKHGLKFIEEQVFSREQTENGTVAISLFCTVLSDITKSDITSYQIEVQDPDNFYQSFEDWNQSTEKHPYNYSLKETSAQTINNGVLRPIPRTLGGKSRFVNNIQDYDVFCFMCDFTERKIVAPDSISSVYREPIILINNISLDSINKKIIVTASPYLFVPLVYHLNDFDVIPCAGLCIPHQTNMELKSLDCLVFTQENENKPFWIISKENAITSSDLDDCILTKIENRNEENIYCFELVSKITYSLIQDIVDISSDLKKILTSRGFSLQPIWDITVFYKDSIEKAQAYPSTFLDIPIFEDQGDRITRNQVFSWTNPTDASTINLLSFGLGSVFTPTLTYVRTRELKAIDFSFNKISTRRYGDFSPVVKANPIDHKLIYQEGVSWNINDNSNLYFISADYFSSTERNDREGLVLGFYQVGRDFKPCWYCFNNLSLDPTISDNSNLTLSLWEVSDLMFADKMSLVEDYFSTYYSKWLNIRNKTLLLSGSNDYCMVPMPYYYKLENEYNFITFAGKGWIQYSPFFGDDNSTTLSYAIKNYWEVTELNSVLYPDLSHLLIDSKQLLMSDYASIIYFYYFRNSKIINKNKFIFNSIMFSQDSFIFADYIKQEVAKETILAFLTSPVFSLMHNDVRDPQNSQQDLLGHSYEDYVPISKDNSFLGINELTFFNVSTQDFNSLNFAPPDDYYFYPHYSVVVENIQEYTNTIQENNMNLVDIESFSHISNDFNSFFNIQNEWTEYNLCIGYAHTIVSEPSYITSVFRHNWIHNGIQDLNSSWIDQIEIVYPDYENFSIIPKQRLFFDMDFNWIIDPQSSHQNRNPRPFCGCDLIRWKYSDNAFLEYLITTDDSLDWEYCSVRKTPVDIEWQKYEYNFIFKKVNSNISYLTKGTYQELSDNNIKINILGSTYTVSRQIFEENATTIDDSGTVSIGCKTIWIPVVSKKGTVTYDLDYATGITNLSISENNVVHIIEQNKNSTQTTTTIKDIKYWILDKTNEGLTNKIDIIDKYYQYFKNNFHLFLRSNSQQFNLGLPIGTKLKFENHNNDNSGKYSSLSIKFPTTTALGFTDEDRSDAILSGRQLGSTILEKIDNQSYYNKKVYPFLWNFLALAQKFNITISDIVDGTPIEISNWEGGEYTVGVNSTITIEGELEIYERS